MAAGDGKQPTFRTARAQRAHSTRCAPMHRARTPCSTPSGNNRHSIGDNICVHCGDVGLAHTMSSSPKTMARNRRVGHRALRPGGDGCTFHQSSQNRCVWTDGVGPRSCPPSHCKQQHPFAGLSPAERRAIHRPLTRGQSSQSPRTPPMTRSAQQSATIGPTRKRKAVALHQSMSEGCGSAPWITGRAQIEQQMRRIKWRGI